MLKHTFNPQSGSIDSDSCSWRCLSRRPWHAILVFLVLLCSWEALAQTAKAETGNAGLPIKVNETSSAAKTNSVGSSSPQKMVLPSARPVGDSVSANPGNVSSVFTELSSEPISMIALTEDGLLLIVAHEKGNKLSIWDVKTGQKTKEISTPAPRHVFCLRGNVYVANYGYGTVSVFAQDTWEQTNQLLVANADVYYISSPQGKYFDDKLLVSCGKQEVFQVRLLDVKNDTDKLVATYQNCIIATANYSGETVLLQHMLYSLAAKCFNYNDFIQGRETTNERSGGSISPEQVLFQVEDSPFWFTYPMDAYKGDNVYYGKDPLAIRFPLEGNLIVDRKGLLVYLLKRGSIGVYRVDFACSHLVSRDINCPEKLLGTRDIDSLRRTTQKDFKPACMRQAVRHDKDVYVFQINEGKLLRGVFPGLLTNVPLKNRYRPVSKPVEAPPLPAKSIEGVLVQVPLVPGGKEVKFSIVKGPAKATIAAGGVLSWMPSAGDVGPTLFKIKAETDDTVSFHRLSTDVVPSALAARVGNDINKLALLGRHALREETVVAQPLCDGSGILLLDGKTLRILDPDGLLVLQEHTFVTPYQKLLDRKEYFVALANDAVDLIDRKTFKVIRHYSLSCQKTNDIVLHPRQPLAYVALVDPKTSKEGSLAGHIVVCLDEQTGNIEIMPRVSGQWLAIDPAGETLYTGLRLLYITGYVYEEHILEYRQIPNYKSIDVVSCYDVFGTVAIHRQTNYKPGEFGKCLRISPDGGLISYVSLSGTSASSQNRNVISAFSNKDIMASVVGYEVPGNPLCVSYHPSYALVAGSDPTSVCLFERETGKPVINALQARLENVQRFGQVLFAPSGKYLMVEHFDKDKSHVLQSLPLTLTPETAIPIPPVRPAYSPDDRKQLLASIAKPREKELKASKIPGKKELDAKQISREYSNAVVVIKDEQVSGSGFFITSNGYILTCGHVVPQFGELTISYREPTEQGFITKDAKAKIIAIDDKLDLAILKIEVGKVSLKHVQLTDRTAINNGEAVYAIGNPGLGNQILDYTITEGIVSNNARPLQGVPYIQITAAVNPGSSGCALFDKTGNVIGVVVLKGEIDGAGFAVPSDRLLKFLDKHTR